jgi:predicted Rossmann-fold nucleotide-binding protein
MPATFEAAFGRVKQLVADFRANEKFHLSPAYSRDSIDRQIDALDQLLPAASGLAHTCPCMQREIMKTKTLLLTICLGTSLVFSGCTTKCTLCPAHATPRAADSFFPPPAANFAFDPFRTNVYSASELLSGYTTNDPDVSYRSTPDWQCYLAAMDETNRHQRSDLNQTNLRYLRLHDLAIEEALDKYLKPHVNNKAGWKKVVGIMGGHDLARLEKITNSAGQIVDSTYMQVAVLAQKLSRAGFTIATGGGPGAMEAGNLGAWFANRSEVELRQAVRMLANVPTVKKMPDSLRYNSGEWLAPAYKVMAQYPRDDKSSTNMNTESIGVPTWFYGQEPPNPFATHIAKYFENSLREEHLLAISTHGVIFAEGSAGTVQEIFQDACQNFYRTYTANHFPMVLFGADFWNRKASGTVGARDKPVWPLLEQLGTEGKFAHLLLLTDDVDAISSLIADYSRKSDEKRE